MGPPGWIQGEIFEEKAQLALECRPEENCNPLHGSKAAVHAAYAVSIAQMHTRAVCMSVAAKLPFI